VPPKEAIRVAIENANETTGQRMTTHEAIIKTLANLKSLSQEQNIKGGTIPFVIDEATGHVFPGDAIDMDAQKARWAEEIREHDKEVAKIEKKLGNQQFLAKAPEDVVAEQRTRLADALDRRKRKQAWLA